ncbi:hypothetical protein [Undibacterium sp.]|jgi:hypothetical protein|uniref:hypothetical protein n=1 Tax=Undibacterium sp. TaxID=1914977 RepID=UPI002C70D010|nr:hypothetical protein [Undibacterium sp.]HTD02262.1 hypothetical protein [Undibacterium sp.]
MKKQRKFFRILKQISVIAIAVAAFTFEWLHSAVGIPEIEKAIKNRLDEQLNMSVSRIECYSEAVGREFKPMFACNYISSRDVALKVLYVSPPFRFGHGIPLYLLDYKRASPGNVQIYVSSPGGEASLNKLDAFWLEALADKISDGMPR